MLVEPVQESGPPPGLERAPVLQHQTAIMDCKSTNTTLTTGTSTRARVSDAEVRRWGELSTDLEDVGTHRGGTVQTLLARIVIDDHYVRGAVPIVEQRETLSVVVAIAKR